MHSQVLSQTAASSLAPASINLIRFIYDINVNNNKYRLCQELSHANLAGKDASTESRPKVDLKVVGVAGVFVALALVGISLLGAGHSFSAVGQTYQNLPISKAGDALSSIGSAVVFLLAILAISVTVSFILRRR